jgi:hypothetical protein
MKSKSKPESVRLRPEDKQILIEVYGGLSAAMKYALKKAKVKIEKHKENGQP